MVRVVAQVHAARAGATGSAEGPAGLARVVDVAEATGGDCVAADAPAATLILGAGEAAPTAVGRVGGRIGADQPAGGCVVAADAGGIVAGGAESAAWEIGAARSGGAAGREAGTAHAALARGAPASTGAAGAAREAELHSSRTPADRRGRSPWPGGGRAIPNRSCCQTRTRTPSGGRGRWVGSGGRRALSRRRCRSRRSSRRPVLHPRRSRRSRSRARSCCRRGSSLRRWSCRCRGGRTGRRGSRSRRRSSFGPARIRRCRTRPNSCCREDTRGRRRCNSPGPCRRRCRWCRSTRRVGPARGGTRRPQSKDHRQSAACSVPRCRPVHWDTQSRNCRSSGRRSRSRRSSCRSRCPRGRARWRGGRRPCPAPRPTRSSPERSRLSLPCNLRRSGSSCRWTCRGLGPRRAGCRSRPASLERWSHTTRQSRRYCRSIRSSAGW